LKNLEYRNIMDEGLREPSLADHGRMCIETTRLSNTSRVLKAVFDRQEAASGRREVPAVHTRK
jgi:hypothetical protein